MSNKTLASIGIEDMIDKLGNMQQQKTIRKNSIVWQGPECLLQQMP